MKTQTFKHIELTTGQVSQLAKLMGLIIVECTDPKILTRTVIITGSDQDNIAVMACRYDDNGKEGIAQLIRRDHIWCGTCDGRGCPDCT